MKKVIFAVLAAFMVSLSFTSCSKSPEGKVMGLMEDAISIMKDTHIKSADDVKAFAEKMKPIKEGVEKAKAEKEGARLKKEAEDAGVDLSELDDLDLF